MDAMSVLPANSDTTAIIGGTIVKDVENYLKRYVSFVDGANAFALALWVAGTHVYEVFDAYGYLTITAGTKRAGKTRLMDGAFVLGGSISPLCGHHPSCTFYNGGRSKADVDD